MKALELLGRHMAMFTDKVLSITDEDLLEALKEADGGTRTL